MMVIGVTGGMASGKSTLARMFTGRGIVHLDADRIVHRLMRNDRETIAAIGEAFPAAVSPLPPAGEGKGEGLLSSPPTPSLETPGPSPRPSPASGRGGRINRAALAEAIGNNPEALATLEHILHPRVRAVEVAAINHARRHRRRAVILDIPLLFETDAQTLCDVVIVAHAPITLRRRRAFARAGMTDVKWEKLIARQLPDHVRRRAADIVIPTSLGKAATRRKVQGLMRQWGLN